MAAVKLLFIVLATFCITYGYYINEAEIMFDSEDQESELEYDYDSFEADYTEDGLEAPKTCSCDDRTGCVCKGQAEGYKVKVTIALDEISRDKKEHISVHVCVNGAHFENVFPVNKLIKYCQVEHGKRFCFKIEVKDDGKEDRLPGCVKMLKPVGLDLGCFDLQL